MSVAARLIVVGRNEEGFHQPGSRMFIKICKSLESEDAAPPMQPTASGLFLLAVEMHYYIHLDVQQLLR